MNRLLVVIIVFFLLIQFAGAQSKNFIDQPYLETLAKIDTLITPDRIFLSILISENDTKGKLTVDELETKMFNKLETIGLELSKQLTITDLSSNFRKYFLKRKDILKAKSYELLVYDATTAGKVIYHLEDIGISNVDFEKTEYSEIEELKLKLKTKAISKAKRQALALVEPLNQTISNVIFISDINNQMLNELHGTSTGISITRYQVPKLKEENKFISIEFEKIKVQSEVIVKFAIN